LRRKAALGQAYYQVWFKGERLAPKPGRSDDFSWPKADPGAHLETPVEAPPGRPAPTPKASPRS
jgi:hypothetical protein